MFSRTSPLFLQVSFMAIKLHETSGKKKNIYNPMDCNPLDSFAHGISQARILEWVDISFSRQCSTCRDQTHIFCIERWIL